MYFYIEPHQQADHPHLMDRMFRLRKKVFCQELQWVQANSDHEKDDYDDHHPVYVMHTDQTGEHLYGCARLMPTNGPTLLSDVFYDTIPDAAMIESPLVWEITRLCVDDDLIREHGRAGERSNILRRMRTTALEFGVENGVEAYLANFDDLRLRMWRRVGARFDVLGTSYEHSIPVHLGISECSQEVLDENLAALGVARVTSAPPAPYRAAAKVSHMPPMRPARKPLWAPLPNFDGFSGVQVAA